MMGDLYSRCLTVYIWLGAVNHSASRRQDPFAFIRNFADDKHYHELLGFYKDETGRLVFEENAEFIALWDDFLFLANSTWWTRALTVQESILPRNCVAMYGHGKTAFTIFRLARERRNSHVSGSRQCCAESLAAFSSSGRRKFDLFLNEIGLIEQFRDYQHAQSGRKHHDKNTQVVTGYSDSCFSETVHTFSSRNCQDPRDRIYSLLAMARSKKFEDCTPNYRATVAECYTDVFERMLAEAGDDYRCMMGTQSGLGLPGLPSWVRDFSQVTSPVHVGNQLRRIKSYSLFNAAGGKLGRPVVKNGIELHVTGVQADEIVAVGPVMEHLFVGQESLRKILAEWITLCQQAVNSVDAGVVHRVLSRAICSMCASSGYNQRMKESWLPNDNTWQRLLNGDVGVLDRLYQGAVEMAMSGRSIYITQAGRIGICNPYASPGDEVWVLFGSNVPFVIRRQVYTQTLPEKYQFVGDCFLDGIMDGDIVKGRTEGQPLILI
jgi:hypothetical protein